MGGGTENLYLALLIDENLGEREDTMEIFVCRAITNESAGSCLSSVEFHLQRIKPLPFSLASDYTDITLRADICYQNVSGNGNQYDKATVRWEVERRLRFHDEYRSTFVEMVFVLPKSIGLFAKNSLRKLINATPTPSGVESIRIYAPLGSPCSLRAPLYNEGHEMSRGRDPMSWSVIEKDARVIRSKGMKQPKRA